MTGCGIEIQGSAGTSSSLSGNKSNNTETNSDSLTNGTTETSETSGETPDNTPGDHANPAPERPSPEEIAAAKAKKERETILAQRAEMPIVDITFDDLKLEIGEDVKFEPEMLTDRVKELEGRKVRIRGYISGTVFQTEGITSFPLMRDTICKFGPGAQAHHNVQVAMTSGNSTKYTTLPITIEGILSIDPFDGPDGLTYSIYRLDGHRTN